MQWNGLDGLADESQANWHVVAPTRTIFIFIHICHCCHRLWRHSMKTAQEYFNLHLRRQARWTGLVCLIGQRLPWV
jgi:hypothetical protein